MKKKIAITGINSYFASTVLKKLETDNTVDKIIGIDVTPWERSFSKVEFHKVDIRSNKIMDILKGVDVLYHMAFVVSEINDKEETFNINIIGSLNVFNACVKNKIEKLIYTSSATVYGSKKNNPKVFYENNSLSVNHDSYYNKSKIEVEKQLIEFFSKHPNIQITILRAALLFGPNINNMFSKLFSLPVCAFPFRSKAETQYLHEEDLGDALHLVYKKNVPGIFNVGADDLISTKRNFRKAGVFIIPLPEFILKPLADKAFTLGLLPASRGWVSLSRYTIYMNCDKFKSATGWKPKYNSRETFESFLQKLKFNKNTITKKISSKNFKIHA